MRRRLTRALAGMVLLGAWPPAPASALSCVETVAAKFTQLAQVRMKKLRHCRERALLGQANEWCPDHHTAAKLARAEREMRRAISAACGGHDGICGVGDDDSDLTAIGWNVGQCPDIHGGGCSNSIHHCGDVADCLTCIATHAVDDVVSLAYDSFTPAPPDAPAGEIQACQRTIGRSLARYFSAGLANRLFCEQRVLAGYDVGPCPDPWRAEPRLASAEKALTNGICRSCGLDDGICGGDDLTPEWIGFPMTCPDMHVPNGPSCARAIRNLGDVVACVRCVTDCQVECLDPLSVPTLQSYPAQCGS